MTQDELKQLRVNEKMIEKYPKLEDFIYHLGSDHVFIPGNIQTQQILLDPQLRESCANLKIICLTPAILKLATGYVFN